MIYRQKNKKAAKNNCTSGSNINHHNNNNNNNKNNNSNNNNNMPSKSKGGLKSMIRGFIFCFLWYFSIFCGFLILICPILPLIVLNPKLYRRWSDLVFGMWEPYPVAMMEILFGVRVHLSGDKINPFEGSIVIMNHRTRLDWNFLWAGMFHGCQPQSHNLKFVLKSAIMHIPGPGWVMQTCSFLFIHRNWEKDQKLLSKVLDYLKETNEVCQILIFPEGTDLSERNIERSHKFADEHNLARYYRVLHPKTTGFAFLANRMRANGQLKAVYDLTVAYPKTLPETELDMLRGKFPEEIHFHVKRYSTSSIPYRETELKNWLNEIWQEKEERLQKFYSNGSFTNHDFTPDCLEQNSTNELLKKCSAYSEKMEIQKSKEISGLQNGITRDFGHYAANRKDGSSNKRLSEHSEMLKQNLINDELASTVPHFSMNENENNFEIKRNSGLPNSSSNYGSRSYFQNYLDCDNNLIDVNYRPSNLLYLSLLFWTSLVIFTIYQLFTNFYIQVWSLAHLVIFVTISLTSNGFHQLVASFYLLRNKKPENPPVLKKCE